MKSVAAVGILVVLMGWGQEPARGVSEAALSTEQFVGTWNQRMESARRDLIRASVVYTEQSEVVRLLKQQIDRTERQRQLARRLNSPAIG